MSLSFSFGKLTSNQSVGVDLPKPETPFRIVVLGDFSGRAARGEKGSADDIGRRRARKIDRENFDDVMAKVAPKVQLPIGSKGKPVTVSFQTLDDFHPDGLNARIDALQDLYGAEEKTPFMNKILHHPNFQALESAWRGLDWLLQGVQKHKAVEVRIIDLSFEELMADLSAAEELEASGLYQLLVDVPAQRGEADPWSVFVGNYLFEMTGPHVEALGRIAKVARQASAPFLAGVTPQVFEPSFALEEDEEAAWTALRQLPEAALLSLVGPRFLVRVPFGENTRTIDAFEFEEYTKSPDWRGYLFSNAALACARLMAESFGKDGWAFRPGSQLDLGGMAMHVTRDEDDEPVATLAETWLTPPVSKRVAAWGIIPLLCVKGRDAVQLATVQSLASPAKGQAASPLMGRWNQSGSVQLPRSGEAPLAAAAGAAVGVAGAAAAAAVAGRASTPAGSPPPASSNFYDSVPAPPATPPPASTNFYDTVQPEPPPNPAFQSARALADTVSSDEMLNDVVWPEWSKPPSPDGDDESSDDDDSMSDLDDLGGDDDSSSDEEDPELAALMGDLDGGDSGDEEIDPELAALMADLGDAEESADEEMDPELAALMADLDESSSESTEDEEMDPELAALLAEAESDEESSEESSEEADEEMDPELAALLAEAEGDEDEETSTADEEMDPELAALLAEAEAEGDDDEETSTEDDEEMDPELAALLAEAESEESSDEEEETSEDEEMDPELAALLAEAEEEGDDEEEDEEDDE